MMNNLTLPFFLNFLFRLGVDQDSIYGAVFGIKNIRVHLRHQRSADTSPRRYCVDVIVYKALIIRV